MSHTVVTQIVAGIFLIANIFSIPLPFVEAELTQAVTVFGALVAVVWSYIARRSRGDVTALGRYRGLKGKVETGRID